MLDHTLRGYKDRLLRPLAVALGHAPPTPSRCWRWSSA